MVLGGVMASPIWGKETITWLQTDFPPGYILKGDEKGQGYGDLLDKYMINALDEYDHVYNTQPNWDRYLKTMHSQEFLACGSLFFYRDIKDREPLKGKNVLSAPSFIFFLHDVVVRKEDRQLYDKEVSYAKLLRNPDLTHGYGRLTGPKFMKILGDYLGATEDLEAMPVEKRLKLMRSKKNIHVRVNKDMVGGLFKMLLHKRVDYILEYSFMMEYEAKRLGLHDQMVSIPVSEVRDDVPKAAFACSDTPEGHKAMDAINAILVRDRNTPEYKKTLAYLVPRDRADVYWAEHEKILDIKE